MSLDSPIELGKIQFKKAKKTFEALLHKIIHLPKNYLSEIFDG
jgi:hypothetical protein